MPGPSLVGGGCPHPQVAKLSVQWVDRVLPRLVRHRRGCSPSRPKPPPASPWTEDNLYIGRFSFPSSLVFWVTGKLLTQPDPREFDSRGRRALSGSCWPLARGQLPLGAWLVCLAIPECVSSTPGSWLSPGWASSAHVGTVAPVGPSVDTVYLESSFPQWGPRLWWEPGVSRPCLLEACVLSVGRQRGGEGGLPVVPSWPGTAAGLSVVGTAAQILPVVSEEAQSHPAPHHTSCGALPEWTPGLLAWGLGSSPCT